MTLHDILIVSATMLGAIVQTAIAIRLAPIVRAARARRRRK